MRLYLPVFFMGGLYFVQILGAGMSGEEWEGVMFSRMGGTTKHKIAKYFAIPKPSL